MVGRSALVTAGMLFAVAIAPSQEPRNLDEALALLAKIEGKAKFDVGHPKRVIAVDL